MDPVDALINDSADQRELEEMSDKKRKSDEGETSEGRGKRLSRASRVSTGCTVKWDVTLNVARKTMKDLGVNFLPAVPGKEPSTPPKSELNKENRHESGYQSGSAPTIVPVLNQESGLTPPLEAIKLCQLYYAASERREEEKAKATQTESNEKEEGPKRAEDMNSLSEEMLLHIFSFLSKRLLAARCSLVCRRWRQVSNDKTLWKGVDMIRRQLLACHVASVLERGVVSARLAFLTVKEPLLSFSGPLSLENLDLTVANISVESINAILAANQNSLKRLSIESTDVNQETFDLISTKHVELQVLNMTLCRINDPRIGFRTLLPPFLKELNISWIVGYDVDNLIKLLPSSLESLNIGGYKEHLKDYNIEELVLICPNLIELDVSDCVDLTAESLFAIQSRLRQLKALHVSRCFRMNDFNEIRNMKSLEVLSIKGLGVTLDIPGVAIDRSIFSTVARPTVGNRRSTIWGIKLH